MIRTALDSRFLGKTITTVALAATLGFMLSHPARADSDARIHGKSYGEWSAGWWEWQEAFFPDFAFGEGTIDCSIGQSGPVWFLAGTGGSDPVVRECQDPLVRHRHLFIPLVNGAFFNPDPSCGEDEYCTIEEKREILNGFFSLTATSAVQPCDLSITVDGTLAVFSTPIVRTQSPPFAYAGDPETVADGYWVMLDPLSRGEHEIHLTGGLCLAGTDDSLIEVDVTYLVTVR